MSKFQFSGFSPMYFLLYLNCSPVIGIVKVDIIKQLVSVPTNFIQNSMEEGLFTYSVAYNMKTSGYHQWWE